MKQRPAAWIAQLFSTILLTIAQAAIAEPQTLRVGSKTFTESHVLGEITSQLLESEGFAVDRKLGLGGTLIAFEALKDGSIDIYPEYTGTLKQAVLGNPGLSTEELDKALADQQLQIAVLLGFENSYAIAIREQTAQDFRLQRISDLQARPELRAGFSHEFLNRSDGWPALSATYGLTQSAVGLEHALAYEAVENGRLDITDAYTTDGELSVRRLRLLTDDRNFFPQYNTVLLTRQDLPPAATAVLQRLEQSLDEQAMRTLNYRVSNNGESPAQVAASYLRDSGLAPEANAAHSSMLQRVARHTLDHLKLTATALLLACCIAIPLSMVVARHEGLARALLYVTGLIQTIPALALLALMIPLVGLGQFPAIIALFLYSLLPIVRNTLTGLFSVDPLLKQVATGMGLTDKQVLWHIELPLAMPTVLAGVRTAAVISIGTATLAAFVGAGGLGEPIITGLNLNDHSMILEGAIPAALLAIGVELIFNLVERAVIPGHLRDN